MLTDTQCRNAKPKDKPYKLADENFDFKIAEALLKSKREKLLSLRTSIDALRTLNANVRIQVNN